MSCKYGFISIWHNRDGMLQWRHNECDGVSNHQPHECLLNCLFGRRSKKTSKLRITGLCAGNSPVTGEFPAQRASNAENGSIWWRHHGVRPQRGRIVTMRSHSLLLVRPFNLRTRQVRIPSMCHSFNGWIPIISLIANPISVWWWIGESVAPAFVCYHSQ